jgi:hypothetical protein
LADVTVTGVAAILRKLARAPQGFLDVAEEAVRAELEIESTESQRKTPVETGALRASHQVSVLATRRDVTGTIAVGGPAAPYALYVHENLEAFHPVGQAKFLESTLTESAPFLKGRIAQRISLREVVE